MHPPFSIDLKKGYTIIMCMSNVFYVRLYFITNTYNVFVS